MHPIKAAEEPPAGKTVEPVTGMADAVAEATASLAPHPTHFAHRPDWQAAVDDAADEQRERSQGA